jgi:hypothetical protein
MRLRGGGMVLGDARSGALNSSPRITAPRTWIIVKAARTRMRNRSFRSCCGVGLTLIQAAMRRSEIPDPKPPHRIGHMASRVKATNPNKGRPHFHLPSAWFSSQSRLILLRRGFVGTTDRGNLIDPLDA